MSFYRDEFAKIGFTECSGLTKITAQAFSMVFDGPAGSEAIFVQGVDFGDGSANISINYTFDNF